MRLKRLVILMGLVLFSGSLCFGYNVYLYVEGVQGECIEANHLNWIDATSYSHSLVYPTGGGAVLPGSIVVGKELDKATPYLHSGLCTGTNYSTVKIEVTEETHNNVIYRIELTNASLTRVGSAADSSGSFAVPTEEVVFTCQAIQWTYMQYDGTGALQGTYQTNWTFE